MIPSYMGDYLASQSSDQAPQALLEGVINARPAVLFTSAQGSKMPSIKEQHISEAEIHKFVELIGLKRAAPMRYSKLLVANLLGGALSGTQNPAKIIREIELLERGEPGRFKKPIQNKHPPLKGLWHKHYMQDGLASLAQNIQKGLNWFDIPLFNKMIQEA